MLQLCKNYLHSSAHRAQVIKTLLQNVEYNFATSQRKTCYYKVLNVSTEAPLEEIKRAYFELAKVYHPDTGNPLSRQVEKFREINEAFEVLSDEALRAKYDEENGIVKLWKRRAGAFSGKAQRQKSEMEENPELQAEMENYFMKKYFLNKDYFKLKNEDEDDPFHMTRKLYNKHKDMMEHRSEEYELVNKFTSYAYYKKKESPKKEAEEKEEK